MTFNELYDTLAKTWKPYQDTDEISSPNELITMSKKRQHFWYSFSNSSRFLKKYLMPEELKSQELNFSISDGMIIINNVMAIKYEN